MTDQGSPGLSIRRTTGNKSDLERRALRATVGSLLVPGLGQILCGARLAGGVIAGVSLTALAVVAWHLAVGVAGFESPLGAFLFRVILRGSAILHAFAVVDAYGRTATPADREGANRRLAVGWNLLVPGVGYVVARAWWRAATGLAVLVLLLFFARAGRMPYLDVIFVGMQAVMAGLVYLQLRLASERAAQARGDLLPPPGPAVAPAAQVLALVAVVVAVIFCGFVVERSLPAAALRGLTKDDLKLSPASGGGLRFEVPRLGLSLDAVGPGWSAAPDSSEFLFRADHQRGGRLMIGIQQIYPFERPERMLRRLRGWLEQKGLVLQQTKDLVLGGASATRLRFSGDFGGGHAIDHWAVVVPRRGFAFLLMMQCDRQRCDEVAPILERSQNTLALATK